MTWAVTIEAECESKAEAERLLSDLEDVVGQHNGELIDSDVEENE